MAYLFYDGECGFCQRSVRMLIARDKRERILFAPLQGPTAKDVMTSIKRAELLEDDSVIFVDDLARIYQRSSAGIRALATCGGVWSMAKVALLIPPFMRDWAYNWFGKRRKRFFAKSACPIPTAHQRSRMRD